MAPGTEAVRRKISSGSSANTSSVDARLRSSFSRWHRCLGRRGRQSRDDGTEALRLTEEKSLRPIDADLGEPVAYFHRFDAFGDGLDPEAAGERNHALDEGLRAGIDEDV